MKIRFQYYGVRGSIPVSGKEFSRYGGSTTCFFVETEKTKLVIDAGTGIRLLGMDLLKREFGQGKGKLHILFTHTHWDHIQGFPFFIPCYIPGNEIHIYGETKQVKVLTDAGREEIQTWSIERTLYMQQMFMYFPASTHNMSANLHFHELKSGQVLELEDLKVESLTLYHPNHSLGFRITHGDFSFVFCTDVEHSDAMIEKLSAFAEGANGLAYDSQYLPEEYEQGKVGWGHSTYYHGIQIAKKANIPHFHLIHHDPTHDDEKLNSIQELAKKEFSNSFLVPEGFSFTNEDLGF